MVKFIVAQANYDVSGRVRSELVSLLGCSGGERRIIYIVPEQFEYETEKAIHRILDEKKLLGRSDSVRITTFSALSRGILERSGETRRPADDIVKSIVMHRAVNDNKTALSTLGKIASRQGFCEKMVQTVSMFKTAGISARDLEESLPNFELDEKLSAGSPVVRKLSEVSLLYGQYEQLISDYIDRLDITGLAAEVIAADGGECAGADIFVDCFNDFTTDQLTLLRRVIGKAENVTFGFASDYESGSEIFKTPNGQISRLKRQAEEDGCEVRFVTDGIADRIAANSPLRELPRHIFGTGGCAAALDGSAELVSAADVYEELDYIAAKIRQLVDEKGMRYREIAVLCTDAGAYGKCLGSVFRKYDIPVFTDVPEPILYQPLINAVISSLNALRGFSTDTVLSCVKSGFFSRYDTEKDERVGLSAKDIDVFENYVYEWALEAVHLKKPFTFGNKRAQNDPDTECAEAVRAGVVEPLLKLQKKLPKGGGTIDGARLTELLYKFLTDDIGIERALFSRCVNESGSGLSAEMVALYQRLWNSLTDILDSLHRELENVPVTLDDYYRLFRDICACASLAKPPQFIDCVLVGDIGRTRADNIKAAFIAGASYESFPSPAPQNGIFSQYETELLRENIKHYGESSLRSVREQYQLSLYRAYRAVSLPSEYLCVSCPEYDLSGEETQRSDVFGSILGAFPGARIIKASEMSDLFYCRTEKAAKTRYAMGLSRGGRENAVLKRALEKNNCADFTQMLDEIRGIRAVKPYAGDDSDFSGRHHIRAATARRLMPRHMGATAVEQLDQCRFKYFCRYALNINERNQRAFTNRKRGDAIHYVLENILREYSGDTEKFCALSRAELYGLARRYLGEYCRLETNNSFSDDRRTEFLFNNLANSAADVLITVQTEFYARSYRPKFFELEISDKDNPKYIIDNETPCAAKPPRAELFSAEESGAASPGTPGKGKGYIETKPLVISLDNGIEVSVSGRVDRVDMFSAKGENDENNENGGRADMYVRVVDYKSSSRGFDLNNAQNGINIQMLLYLFALCDANKDNPQIRLCPGGVCYTPSRNPGAADDSLPPFRLLAMSYHPNELFISDRNTAEDLRRYTDFIFGRLTEEGGIDEDALSAIMESYLPNAVNSADAESFEKLRGDCLAKVTENLDKIYGGDVDALPLNYSEGYYDVNGRLKYKSKDACKYCNFKDICGNAGKNAVVIPRAAPKTTLREKAWDNPYLKKNDAAEDTDDE